MKLAVLAALGTLLAGCAVQSVAQEISSVPENLLGMVGDWRLEQEDQTLPSCALTFTEDQGVGGWHIHQPEPCPLPFPSASSLVAWNVEDSTGAVVIANAEGDVVLRLIEGEDGLFMTEPGVVPAFYLMLPYDQDGMGGEAADE